MISPSRIEERKRAWRRAGVLTALLTAAVVCDHARAADMSDDDILRGSFAPQPPPPSALNWSGPYLGGQIGVSSGTANYGNGVSSLTSYILRDSILQDTVSSMTTMGRESATHSNFGAFIGYNFDFGNEIILGVEGNYTNLNLESSAADGLTRIIQNDSQAPAGHHYYYTTTVDGSASVKIKDYMTLRARAGWEIGQFLPYAFGGLAIGRADYSRSATVSYTTEDKVDAVAPPNPPLTPAPPPNFGPVTNSESQSNAIAYGFAAGLGLDVAILPNVFLRAEWEYVQFAPIHDIQVNFNTGRVGAGVRF
jgi:outer membrane immunogenic protein